MTDNQDSYFIEGIVIKLEAIQKMIKHLQCAPKEDVRKNEIMKKYVSLITTGVNDVRKQIADSSNLAEGENRTNSPQP